MPAWARGVGRHRSARRVAPQRLTSYSRPKGICASCAGELSSGGRTTRPGGRVVAVRIPDRRPQCRSVYAVERLAISVDDDRGVRRRRHDVAASVTIEGSARRHRSRKRRYRSTGTRKPGRTARPILATRRHPPARATRQPHPSPYTSNNATGGVWPALAEAALGRQQGEGRCQDRPRASKRTGGQDRAAGCDRVRASRSR